MKTIFDEATRDELIQRIGTLSERSLAQWGQMNIYQMLTHCIRYEEMILRGHTSRQTLIGRLIGKRVLKGFIGDDRPVKRNLPTLPQLKVSESDGDVALQKTKWIALIEEYSHYSKASFLHPFFGMMTREQTGYLDYKHTDHHLRQFGA